MQDVAKQASSPFDPVNEDAYLRWRAAKLDGHPHDGESLVVEVGDPGRLQPAETDALIQRCRQANMVIYRSSPDAAIGRQDIARLGEALGLVRLDHTLHADDSGINLLQVEAAGLRRRLRA